MERTPSSAIRQEKDDLKEAAEHSFNVIVDLSLEGNIRWVSPSWQEIIG
jgi:serine/threonine-protein kinase RIM15